MSSKLSEFLENFSPISLHYKQSPADSWVFWSESEGYEINSSSADLGTPTIHDMIKTALSNIDLYNGGSFAQFWAPVTIDGRRLLSTSAQPFAVLPLCKEFVKYRVYSEKYKYNIDVNYKLVDNGHDHPMIISSGGPATAFLNCRTSIISKLQDNNWGLGFSVMLPICFPSDPSNCIGVLEFTFNHKRYPLATYLFQNVEEIKKAGLDVFYVRDLIPYKTVNGLEVTKGEIEEVLKVVCESHNLALAQVWIRYEDKNNVPYSYSLEASQTKRLFAIKLTGYLYAVPEDGYDDFEPYFRSGDVIPRAIEEELSMVTLQDYESRYISKLRTDMLEHWDGVFFHPTSALALCLRSNDTGDFNYMFEFLWTKHSNDVIFLEAILLTLKRCLPRFKFASGAELGDELNVIDVETSTDDKTEEFKIFQGKRSSPMPEAQEERKKTMVVNYIAPSEVTCKTTLKVLPREVIEKQFGKTMKDAAENLDVSVSTLKRKYKKLRIPEWPPEWPGPNFVKRNKNVSSTIQINTNEEDSGAIEDSSNVNRNENVLTLKAEYANDTYKLHLPISQATFSTVEKAVGMKLNLSVGTFKLNYIDEDKEWISLTSDEDMNDCINSSKRLRVLPSPQPISGPSGSLGTFII